MTRDARCFMADCPQQAPPGHPYDRDACHVPATPVDAATEAWPRPWPCPGRDMPQPEGAPNEGYVACYLAGHDCTIRTETDGTVQHTLCACCGEGYGFAHEYGPGGYSA